MGAIFNVRKAMASYRLPEELSTTLERVLRENIAKVHSLTRLSEKAVSITTQERRCATICRGFVDLRKGGFECRGPR
jgi:hypothetical protein